MDEKKIGAKDMKRIKSILCKWITGFTPLEIESTWNAYEFYRAQYHDSITTKMETFKLKN